MSKKARKILSVVIISITAIIIALGVFTKFYITPERIKAFLIPAAEKALNRKVNIDELNISLFKGIEIKDFAIKEADGKTDFLTSKNFVLKYKLLPLLSRKVIIDELKILSPEFRIIRSRDGRFNFESIGEQKPAKAEEGEKAAEEPKKLPVSLLINRIVLEDARFSLRDHKNELPDITGAVDIDTWIKILNKTDLLSGGSIDLRLENVIIKKPSEKHIKNITAGLDYEVSVNLEKKTIQIKKADIKAREIAASITGVIKNFKTSPEIDIAVSLPNTKAADILESVKPFIDTKGVALSGGLTADLKLKGMPGKPGSLKTDARVVLEKANVTYNDISTVIDGEFQFNLTSNSIHIDKADIKAHKVTASVTGDVKNLKTVPEIDIVVLVPGAKTSDILELVKPFIDTKGVALTGDITADVHIRGMPKKLDTLQTNGRIHLEKTGIDYNDVSAILDGDLSFKKQTVTIDLKSIIGNNTAELKGSVSSFLKNQKINLNLYSKNLELDKIIPSAASGDTASARKGKTAAEKPSSEAKPLDLKITAEGEIKVESAKYKNLKISNFYTKYQLKDNKFKVIKMTGNAGKGKFSLVSDVDLSKPGYTYNFSSSIDSLHADEVVNSFFPKAKNTVFGILSSTFQLSGAGTTPENVKKNLVGSGNFNVKNGKITNSKLPETLAQFLGIDELRTIVLKKADGTVKIKNGKARLDSIFSSDDISMDPAGNIGLDETLDLAFDLKLSPKFTDKVLLKTTISQYIKDEKGWGRIPLKVSGTFSKPSYRVDVAKAGERIIKKKAKELLEDLLEKNKDKEKGESLKENDKKPVEDLIKDLFK